MKLGYEFYAPRILDEMQKNPTRSFEDTEYWRAFQKHLKSYTDKVLLQTINSLAEFPKQTLDALQEKFGEFLSDSYTPSVSREGVSTLTSASNLGSQLVTIRLDLGQGFRREDPSTRQEGPSLFELDELKKREIEQSKRVTQQDIEKAKRAVIDRAQQVTHFQRETAKIPESKIPPRSTIRPAGQSIRLERQKLINELSQLGNDMKAAQARFNKNRNTVNKVAINHLIIKIKKAQQKITFLIQNYTF